MSEKRAEENKKGGKKALIDRRTAIYAAVFSVASYAIAAAMALGVGAYTVGVLGPFLDPVVTLTVPLILISIGIQAINRKFGILLIALISAVLYVIVPFLSVTFLVAGPIVELVSWGVGYRSFKAVMVNTTLAGWLIGFLSVLFGFLFLGVPHIPHLVEYLLLFAVVYLVESAVMGYISYYIGSYLVKSGVLR